MNEAKVPIAVFASGRGSNFDAILQSVNKNELPAEIRVVISDQPGAGVLAKAQAAGIPVRVIEPLARDSGHSLAERRDEHERRILAVLEEFRPRFLVLAGYMRILTMRLIDAFRSELGYVRIVNVHPSLLPAFPGVDAYAQAFRYGVKATGVSVHLVELGVDQGPVCAQEAFSIADCGSVEEIERRGLAVEHRLYPETLRWVLREEFKVMTRDGRLCVCKN